MASEVVGDVEIFTGEEMVKLLSASKPEILPFLAIGGFAGLRHEEINRLDWSDIKLEAGQIELKAAASKTRVPRIYQ